MDRVPKIPLGDGVEALLDFLTDGLAWLTRAFSSAIETGIDGLVDLLLIVPPWLLIIAISAVTGLPFWE